MLTTQYRLFNAHLDLLHRLSDFRNPFESIARQSEAVVVPAHHHGAVGDGMRRDESGEELFRDSGMSVFPGCDRGWFPSWRHVSHVWYDSQFELHSIEVEYD